MSTSHSQESRTDQSGKRRKRKDRSASRAPEPKNIVSGAGQPLDVSVRRELEEQLGHDFGRVRLHTDRDAGTLTEMLGADAVAVGQDIFFREGAYRPGTADGQRLLAHELLHTVQNPHGLGALRAGRDLGAVSLPQQATEREAESAAQESVREGEPGTPVEEGHATPGWLRYATVDADRNRLEQIDPATLVDRLANSVVRSLRGDPEDRSKRTRMQLARLPDELQDAVLDRLETRLLSSEHERVLDLVDEIEIDEETDQQMEQSSLDAPAVESDLFEEVAFERERERQSAEERQEETDRPPVAPGPEKEWSGTDGAPGSTPQNGGTPQDGTTPQGGEAPRGGEQAQEPGGAGGGGGGPAAEQQPSAGAPSSQQAAPEQGAAAGGKSEGGKSEGGKSEGGKSEGEPQGGEKKSSGAEEKEAPEQQEAPAASEEESAARNRPGAVDALVAGQQVKPEDKRGEEKPTGSPRVSGKDAQDPGPFSRLDGVRNQDLDLEEKTEEDPFGSGSESEVEVGGGEKSAWDIKLLPEDFLPEQDLDVSGVPTADELDPSSSAAPPTPSFPAPPVTKADKVQAEREAEDAEDEAAEAEEESAGADALGDTEPSAEQEESTAGAGESGGLALDRAASSPPAPGSMTKDPKSGADPKAGPVAAQTAVQEASGKSEGGSDSKEAAAKEEKGTPAAGDKAGAGQEKASPQPAGGQASAPDSAAKEEQKKTDASPAGRSEPTADSQGSSPARDSHVSGESNADKPGVATSDAAAGTQSGSSGADQPTPSEPRAETTAPKAPAPAAPEPVKAPEAPAAAPAPKSGPAPKPAPAAKAHRGGGGGGGGGKASAPAKGKKDSAPAPNLSGVAPEAGLATASKLKPHTALQAMGGVSGSVDRTVGDEHKALAAAPPSMQRPAGAPQTLEGKPKADAPAQYSQDPAQKSEAPKDEKAEVTGAKEPEGQIEAEKAEEPGGWDTFKMALGFGIGKVLRWVGFEVDAQELAAKFAGLPTKDEALKQAQAGNAPGVEMQGAAEQTAGEQGTAVDAKGRETVTTARDDSGRAMGENQVYPDAPKEQMQAKVPGGQGGKGGGAPAGGSPTGVVPPEAASEVAEHERGPQFQAAFSDGQKGMSEGRQTKDRDFRDSQQKHKQKVDAEIATNTESQAGEREKAMSDVTAQRADWRSEQDAELKKLGTKKTERHEKVRKAVKDKEEKTDEDVAKEEEDGDKKIQDENTKAERDAEKKRDDSVNESGNWVTKAFDWIKQKVIEIKNAIVRVIRAARDAVIGFIKNFKETVERWINEARKFIVDTVKNLINDLIEFAKAMVRAVIELANRIRKFITDLIAAAIALVNRLANMLKQIISDLLDAIGKLLSSILDILKKMLQDVIKAVVDAIKSVLDFAAKLLSALGDFMLIAVDFLSDPGGWLGGAKNSAVDGAKNHLFREVQAAVKSWFQSKIEEIIGVPKAILDKLIKGGITLEQIVKETWDAIVPQLPFIIGEIVITKVIAKLIPGAGWVMAVIDAIRVAIGALGEILRAMGAVLTWLKAVRQGGAGVLFAKAVAAGIVALLELAYEALLSGIGKYVAKVGRRLKGVAANLGKDKGGDKDKAPGSAGAPADDKKGGPAPTPSKPTTTPGPRPTTPRPGPGTRPGPGRPTTPGPSGKPKTGPGDGKKPTGPDKDAPGRPKDKDQEKSPTRPTPTPAPKPKTETEPDPKSRPPKDDTPAKPKDDKDAPGNPQDQDPSRPKDQDSNRPKDKDDTKDGPAKPKDDKADGKKPDKPKDGDGGKPKDKDRDKGPAKPKKDKGKDDEPKDKDPEKKQETKDQRKKEEDSKESKEERLRKIIARIRPKLKPIMQVGVPRLVLNATLSGMRAWYRLTSLGLQGRDSGTVTAELNPTGPVLPFHSTDGWEEDEALTRAREEARRQEAEATRNLRAQERGRDAERDAQQREEGASEDRPAQSGLSPELRRILAAPLPGHGKRRARRRKPSGKPIDVTKGESLTFRKAKNREVSGDGITPDHIPSGAALIHAAQRKAIAREEERLGTKMTDAEILKLLEKEEFITIDSKGNWKRGPRSDKLYKEALTLMVTGKEHEYRKADPEGGSRTHGKRNDDRQIALDARDLTKATEDDFRFYLKRWHETQALVKSQVYSMVVHYKRLTDRKEIEYSDSIDNMLLYYWKKARNDAD
ncbi:eCIS core domain-containing protein [Streptomyces sp. NPDC002867]